MLVTCKECGAELRLNPKLAGTAVSCPQCGERVSVPAPKSDARSKERGSSKARVASPKLQLEPEPVQADEPVATKKRPEPVTFYLLAAQGTLLLLALLSFVAGFRPGDWAPPPTSWFAEHQLTLIGIGIAFAFCAFMARYLPLLMTLLAVLLVCGGVYAGHYFRSQPVDASRTLALSATLLAVWFAMEHRRSTKALGSRLSD
jgi:DNA-directed RNA polymerase subunit RPC12/RpoP